ncbi:MAG TPA: hypothetical protein DEO91_04630, partial [Pseudomonas sp.]|nr:hypothetical protein [Pseudomonas sp.]
MLGLDLYAGELARLGDIQRLLESAATLRLERDNPFIAALIEAGLFEQAIEQIERLDILWRSAPYELLLDTLLQRGYLQEAEELIAAADESVQERLLLRLLRWRFDHGKADGVQQDIERMARHEALRIDLCLSLWKLYRQSHAEAAACLLDQAEQRVEALPDGEERDQLRLFVIESRLEIQLRQPERQRNSYDLRRALEEMQRLTACQPMNNKLHKVKHSDLQLQRVG